MTSPRDHGSVPAPASSAHRAPTRGPARTCATAPGHPCAGRRRRLLAATAALALALSTHLPATPARESAAPIEGSALDVQDGDSFLLRADDGRRIRVRVSGIDAPERTQPYTDASRRHLGELLRGHRIRLEPVKQDVFDRTVARVLVVDGEPPERDAGLAQLEAGLAWHFRRYSAEQPSEDVARYARAERDAKARGLGLWRDAAPEAPWAFRARLRRPEAERAEGSRERR
jgi:endonuclease YncB( thermonuclease family)